MAIELKTGLGKDGDSSVGYVRDFPTHYLWRERVKAIAEKTVNLQRFQRRIWINTYRLHPPAFPHEHISMDVWGFGGRGDPLPQALGAEVFRHLFRDPDPPDVWWCIYRGRMFVRNALTFETHWEPAPPGPPGSDANHDQHMHFTYLQSKAQQRFRRALILGGSAELLAEAPEEHVALWRTLHQTEIEVVPELPEDWLK